jgi:hypothetical protein
VLDDTSWERFTRVADAVSGVWSSSVGRPGWGRQMVLLLRTDGKWKVPLGVRSWRKEGLAKAESSTPPRVAARIRPGGEPVRGGADPQRPRQVGLAVWDAPEEEPQVRARVGADQGAAPLWTRAGAITPRGPSRVGGQRRPSLLGDERSDITHRDVKAPYSRRQQLEET